MRQLICAIVPNKKVKSSLKKMLTYKADIRFCVKKGNAPMILLT